MAPKTSMRTDAEKSAKMWRQAGPEYFDEAGARIDTDKLEYPEQVLAHRYIRSSDAVLELGARYGTVSCVINKRLADRAAHVAVEPDARVWPALERNRAAHGCAFGVVKGFVSGARLGLANTDRYFNGYAATAVPDAASEIPSFSLAQVRAQFGVPRFSVLVADCEGFLGQFFDENPELLDELRMVMFERDYPLKCDYAKVEAALAAHGFREKKWTDFLWEDVSRGRRYVYNVSERFQNVWIKPPPRKSAVAAKVGGWGRAPRRTRRSSRR